MSIDNRLAAIAPGFVYSFEDFRRRVQRLSEQLDEEKFWTNPYTYGNSVGTLVLHLTGNLSHFIGTHIAGTGYVRQRDLEFSSRLVGQKAEVLQKLDDAIDLVIKTVNEQSDDDWAREYVVEGVEERDRFGIFLRCTAHFHHHIGQMIYLTKELTRA